MTCQSIKGGFSFCGVDISELGLTYVPEIGDTYVFKPTEVNVHQETFDGHDGGYFYGVSKRPKEFILRCYFEDEAIDKGVMERIYWLFRIGKSGKLVFSRKPWCYYYATVTSLPHPELSNYLNGLITITMTASYPLARSDIMFFDPYTNTDQKNSNLLLENTALAEKEEMVPQLSFSDLDARTSILLHNPGTERAPLSIMLSGDAGLGVVIQNKTTNQECKIVAMDKVHTSDVQKSVYIDGINGTTTLLGENSQNIAFMYHDSGFIQLEPAFPAIRNVYIESSDDDVITLVNTLCRDVTGMYIYIDEWVKIEEQIDEQTLRLSKSVSTIDINRTMITSMNEIEIIPVDTMDLTRISFSYKPTYA